MPSTRAVFVSANFPSSHESAIASYDLNQLLAMHARGGRFEVLAARPRFPFVRSPFAQGRDEDGTPVQGMRVFFPWVLYLPRSQSALNARLYAASISGPLRRRCAAFGPRFLWSSFVFPDGVAVGRLARRLRLPHVVTVVGSDLNWNLHRPARVAAIRRCAGEAVLVLAKSRALRDVLVAQGVDAAKIVVDYNGVDTRTFRPRPRAEACAQLGESPDPRRILFVGSLLPVKNVSVLLRAFARLCQRWSGPLELALVGEGFLRATLAEEAARLRVTERVRFLGARAHAEIALWLGASDLLCLPSLAEGVPNVVLEALSAGRPVVASAVGGIPEVHPGAMAGALVPSDDEQALAQALEQTLSTPFDAERLAASMAVHTWDANAAQVFDCLTRLGLASP